MWRRALDLFQLDEGFGLDDRHRFSSFFLGGKGIGHIGVCPRAFVLYVAHEDSITLYGVDDRFGFNLCVYSAFLVAAGRWRILAITFQRKDEVIAICETVRFLLLHLFPSFPGRFLIIISKRRLLLPIRQEYLRVVFESPLIEIRYFEELFLGSLFLIVYLFQYFFPSGSPYAHIKIIVQIWFIDLHSKLL